MLMKPFLFQPSNESWDLTADEFVQVSATPSRPVMHIQERPSACMEHAAHFKLYYYLHQIYLSFIFSKVKIIVFTINYKNINLFLLFMKKLYTADMR